jgi:hypothetical protein
MLNNLLKNELGFQGFVMSDWQAQHTGAASAVAGLVTNLFLCPISRAPYLTGREDVSCTRLAPRSLLPKEVRC